MKTQRADISQFRETVDEVARSLALVRHEEEVSYIRTPVMFPGGTMVVVRVSPMRDKFDVSDLGAAHHEADMMGAEHAFGRIATQVAEKAGALLERTAFAFHGVSRAQLAAAVATIAACSQEAVQILASRLSERRVVEASERLYTRLARVFSADRVTRDAEVMGASNTKWSVGTLVRLDSGRAVFETVNEHPNSVAAAVAKFIDLSHLADAPSRVAVVGDKKTFGTRLALVASAAQVIEERVPDQTLQRVAHAA